jgi:acyl-phosphate glycerol 3-phosphate acyltransferase
VILPCCAIAAVAYLLGSIPFGYLLMRVFRKQDIRSIGSGNIGATNVMRSGAHGLGIATFILDVLKGCTAVWLGGYLASLWMPAVPLRTAEAFAALLRRAWPHVPHLARISWRQRASPQASVSFSSSAPGPRSPPLQLLL